MPRARPQLARRLRGRAWRAAPPTVGRLGHGGRLPGCGGGGGGSSGKRIVEVHLWWRRPGSLWENLDQGARGLPFCQQHGKLCQEASPQGQRAGARRSWELSQVCPVGPASRVTPGRDLGACDSILLRLTSARGPQTLSLLSGGSRGPYPSPFRELDGSTPWSSPASGLRVHVFELHSCATCISVSFRKQSLHSETCKNKCAPQSLVFLCSLFD